MSLINDGYVKLINVAKLLLTLHIIFYLPSFQSVVRLVMFHVGNSACSHWIITAFVETSVPVLREKAVNMYAITLMSTRK